MILRDLRKASLSGALLLSAFGMPALAQSQTGTVAYPKNPSGTPAAVDGGTPIDTKASCASAPCPEKPGAAGHAGDTSGKDQTAGVRNPSAAYPGNPIGTPGTSADGKTPN